MNQADLKKIRKGEEQAKTIGIVQKFGLFVLPLIGFPWLQRGFETPKVLLFQCITLTLFCIIVYKNLLTISKPIIFGVGSIGLLIFTTVTFHSSDTVWFHNPDRMQGLFLQLILLIWTISATLIVDKFRLSYIPLVILLLVVVSGFFLSDEVTGRSVGLIGEPNSFSGICVILGVFSYFLLPAKKYKKFQIVLILFLVSCAIIFSASRSSLLSGLLSLGIVGCLQIKHVALKYAVILASFFLGSTLLLPFFSTDNPWENRAMIWQTAVVAGLQSPVIGHGFGNITQALQAGARDLQNEVRFQYVDSSHNVVLDWWVQGGSIGAVTLVYFIVFSLRTFIKNRQVLELVLLFACLQLMLFNPVSITILAVFWWCVGRGFSKINLTDG